MKEVLRLAVETDIEDIGNASATSRLQMGARPMTRFLADFDDATIIELVGLAAGIDSGAVNEGHVSRTERGPYVVTCVLGVTPDAPVTCWQVDDYDLVPIADVLDASGQHGLNHIWRKIMLAMTGPEYALNFLLGTDMDMAEDPVA